MPSSGRNSFSKRTTEVASPKSHEVHSQRAFCPVMSKMKACEKGNQAFGLLYLLEGQQEVLADFVRSKVGRQSYRDMNFRLRTAVKDAVGCLVKTQKLGICLLVGFRQPLPWGRGYFAVSSGQITDEMIMEYIAHQDEDEKKRGDDFTITEL